MFKSKTSRCLGPAVMADVHCEEKNYIRKVKLIYHVYHVYIDNDPTMQFSYTYNFKLKINEFKKN